MADLKISALTASTTPLAGTEVLPIVQSSTTKQVSVANLTAGRAVSASSLALTTALPVTSGGTGTGTAFTAGSVVFAGASGTYSQNNGNFFWDNTNAWLGIGTSPSYALSVLGATIDINGASVYPKLQFRSSSNTSSIFSIGRGSSAEGAITTSSNLPITININSSEVGRFTSTGFSPVNGAGIDFSATPGTGTSELLADYERGTWTPTGNNITYTAASGTYVKVGALVTLYYSVTFPVTVDVNQARLGGLPYVSSNTTLEVAGGVANLVTLVDGNTFGRFLPVDLTLYTANNTLSGLTIIGQISYEV